MSTMTTTPQSLLSTLNPAASCRYWEAPEITGIHRLPGRATLPTYQNATDAQQQRNAQSILLDGMWRFNLVGRPEATPEDFTGKF